MDNDEKLDLLDLDNGSSLDALPAAPVLGAPRPKKPWLLLGVGLTVIILATYIIIRTIGDDASTTMEVDLDAPVAIVGAEDNAPLIIGDVPVDVQPAPIAAPQPVQVMPAPKPQPVVAPIEATPGVPMRVVEERKAVTFNPAAAPAVEKPVAVVEKPVVKPTPKPVAKPAAAAPVKKASAPVKKAAPKPVAASKGSWYVQFGSYSTNALAQAAQRKIVSTHSSLFAGHQPVILAAVLPNGTTTYRLRVPFQNAKAANGFCQNAKSDGLDCYVAK